MSLSNYTFFYKQSSFDPRPENRLSFSEKSPQKLFRDCLVDGLLTSIVYLRLSNLYSNILNVAIVYYSDT